MLHQLPRHGAANSWVLLCILSNTFNGTCTGEWHVNHMREITSNRTDCTYTSTRLRTRREMHFWICDRQSDRWRYFITWRQASTKMKDLETPTSPHVLLIQWYTAMELQVNRSTVNTWTSSTISKYKHNWKFVYYKYKEQGLPSSLLT